MKNFNLNKVKKYYNKKFELFGNSIKTIGWSNRKDQYLRFEKLVYNYNFKNKTILDVGCGFGDFYKYLILKKRTNFQYIGLDISEKILIEAKNKIKKSNVTFINSDLLNFKHNKIDYSVSSGALTYEFKNSNEYAKKIIKKMYEISNISCSINFMSTYCDYKLKKNQHYSPEKIFKFAKSLSPKVNLIHDYDLFEFTIQIYK